MTVGPTTPPPGPFRRRLLRNTAATAAANGWTMVLSLASVPFLLRGLGIEAFGVWALLQSFSAVTGWLSLADLGVGLAATRHIADHASRDDVEARDRGIATTLLLCSTIGASFALVVARDRTDRLSRRIQRSGLVGERSAVRRAGLRRPSLLRADRRRRRCVSRRPPAGGSLAPGRCLPQDARGGRGRDYRSARRGAARRRHRRDQRECGGGRVRRDPPSPAGVPHPAPIRSCGRSPAPSLRPVGVVVERQRRAPPHDGPPGGRCGARADCGGPGRDRHPGPERRRRRARRGELHRRLRGGVAPWPRWPGAAQPTGAARLEVRVPRHAAPLRVGVHPCRADHRHLARSRLRRRGRSGAPRLALRGDPSRARHPARTCSWARAEPLASFVPRSPRS